MLTSKVLYFPYIRIPASMWLVRILLYWDEVGTITPYEFTQEPERHDRLTRHLIQEGLVRQIIPSLYVHGILRFVPAFMEYLESLGSERLDARRGAFATGQGFLIHVEKLDTLSRKLANVRLARDGPDSWIEVERETAREFTVYLAATLGRLPDLAYAPVTDEGEYLEAFMRAGTSSAALDRLERLRVEVLEELFPGPGRGLSVTELARFKQRHGAELVRFRRRVEQELTDVADISDDTLRERRLQLFLAEAHDEIDEIRSHMAEAGWLGGVLGKFTAVLAAIPGASPILGLVSAVYEALGSPAKDPRSPFLYAFQAQEDLLGGRRP